VKTRASVLAIMNPTGNYWDPAHVLDNFPKGWRKPEILSRYDFIAVFVSPRKLTEFTSIVRTMLNRMTGKLPAPLIDELKVYIQAARKLRPKLTEDVSEYITDKMGELYSQWEQYEIRVLPRTAEALTRLSIALARLTWNNEVTRQHVDIAFKIVLGLSEYMKDPIERGILTAALSASESKLIRTVLAFLRDNCPVCGSEEERTSPCNKYEIAKQIQATIEQDPEANTTLIETLSKKGYSTFTAWFDERALRILNEAGYILINGPRICIVSDDKE
jgi:DNA replicative helicase MCM subunit Mcm2 (Cdc46/Mcm family)